MPASAITNVKILKKSLDSRGRRKPRYQYNLALEVNDEWTEKLSRRDQPLKTYVPWQAPEVTQVTNSTAAERPVIIGTGPAGLFCAHRLCQAGIPPIVIERGPAVK